MKKYLILIFILFIVSCNKKTAITIAENDFSKQNYIPAKVVLQTELAGCGYMLALEDGSMLQPINLNDTLKQNDLKLWIKYRHEKNAMSVCMMGVVVKIDEVKLRSK